MSRIITFEIYGEYFSPQKTGFKFNCQNERGEIETSGIFKGKTLEYGAATYIVPKMIVNSHPFKHLADIFEPLLDTLKDSGATSWHINIGRLYYAQCNEELSYDDLREITRLKCNLAYSAYSVDTEEEEIEGFDYDKYCR